MSRSVLHLLSQRPGLTGSGVALNAIVEAACRSGWQQTVSIGTPVEDASPVAGGLDSDHIYPLLFETSPLDFPVPGMSDVMPYASTVFSRMTADELNRYQDAWRTHLIRIIERHRPDVIHSHHIWLMSSLLKDIAPDIPVVTHCHATGLRQLELCPHLADEVIRGCRRNDHFVVLHRGHADELQQRLEVPSDRISIAGSGYNPAVFHGHGREVNPGSIVYAGKLSRSKGVPWLLDAAERLARRVPGFQLHMAGSGSGSEADEIRSRLTSLPFVTYHGQVDQAQLAALFRRSAVFVLPSFYEGLPLVLVEAAACGCRLVSTSLPGVVEQLAPQLGETLTCVGLPELTGTDEPVPEDLPSFVDRLEDAIDDALKQPPTDNPQDVVSSLSWCGVFEQIEQVWLDLIQ